MALRFVLTPRSYCGAQEPGCANRGGRFAPETALHLTQTRMVMQGSLPEAG